MISKKFKETLDKLQETTAEVERLFNEKRFTVEAFVSLDSDFDGEDHWLGWSRLPGHREWRLVEQTRGTDTAVKRPLRDAPLELRIAAAGKFDGLHMALIDAMMEREEYAEAQLVVATKFIEALKNSKVIDE